MLTHCESTSGFTNASSLDLVPTAAGKKNKILKSNLIIIMILLLCMVKELY